jgi:hypothetical protein
MTTMNAAQVHLMVVHVPVVGLLGVALLLALGLLTRNEGMLRAGHGFLLLCTACAAAAYVSGPWAWEIISGAAEGATDLVASHAVLGRALLVGLVLASIVALNALLQAAQGMATPRWQHALILGSVLPLAALAAWTAHSGGLIRHPEVRAVSPASPSPTP